MDTHLAHTLARTQTLTIQAWHAWIRTISHKRLYTTMIVHTYPYYPLEMGPI